MTRAVMPTERQTDKCTKGDCDVAEEGGICWASGLEHLLDCVCVCFCGPWLCESNARINMLHGEMKGSTAGGGPLAYISRPTFKFLERKACVAKVCHRSAVAVI